MTHKARLTTPQQPSKRDDVPLTRPLPGWRHLGGVFAPTGAQAHAATTNEAAANAAANRDAPAPIGLPFEDEGIEDMEPRFEHATVESMQTHLFAPLAEEFCKGGKVKTAVELHFNKQLAAIGARKIACDPKTKSLYKTSYDGKPAQSWIDDVHRGLVEHAPNQCCATS